MAGGRQGLQALVAPVRLRGEKDHPQRVGHRDVQALFAPAGFKGCEVDLDSHHAQDVLAHPQRRGNEGAGCLGRNADAIEHGRAARHGLLKVRPKAVVVAHVAGFGLPVAGGQGVAIGVDQVDRRHFGSFRGKGQVVVGLCHQPCIPG
jgi:hypothetical protein